ncbi:radical SAM protein [Paraliomyxa miuraensis]|uniref:radical SAM protein n=1 Tax=Paraliomyxa miuraensis TaxID=376150 RepID=UPI002250BE62|nr:radical SAM protein [Paraliomyxa miuraensis]MCX4243666.1 radical SAM protein [Paraliomyxa miuraensis]
MTRVGLKVLDVPEPSARDLTEASTVTARRSGHQFEIQLGHMCNNRCVFCVSGHLSKRRMVRPLEVQPILDVIERARRDGAVRIVFLGGEPTIQPAFFPALEHAARLGFSEIVIFTNGVRLAQEGFIDACLALGRFTWRISIQGANEAAHVAVTKKSTSFQRIITGIEMLRARGQRVTVNMCVCEQSYRSLPDYPALVAKHGIKQLHIDIVRPQSSGIKTVDYLREIMPKYSVMAPYYDQMLRGFDEWDSGFDVNIGNLPYCILPQWGHRIHHGGENTVTQSTSTAGLEHGARNKYAVHNAQRTFTKACPRCAFADRCSGVFKDYLEVYGEDEFQPVTLEQLRDLDPEQNNFTVLVAPFVGLLVQSPPPPGWISSHRFDDARSRRVELRFERSGGAVVTLLLSPASGTTQAERATAAFTTNQFCADVTVEGWCDDEDLTGLVRWAFDVTTGDPRVQAIEGVDEQRVLAARGEHPVLSRSRTRMHRLVRALQRTARFAGWRYEGSERAPDGNAAIIHVGGPEGMSLSLRISAHANAGRSRLDATFSLSEGTDEAAARPAIEAMVMAMKHQEAAPGAMRSRHDESD